MFCPQCGTKNPDGAAFCANCGTPLRQQGGNQQTRGDGAGAPGASAATSGGAAAPDKPGAPAHTAGAGTTASAGAGATAGIPSGTPAQGTPYAPAPRPRTPLSKGKIAAIAAVAVVAIAGGVFAYGKSQGAQAASASSAQIVQAFQDQYGPDSGFEGFASTQYVGTDTYYINDAHVTSSDGFFSDVSGTLDANVSNRYFQSQATLSYTAKADAQGNVSDVKFDTKEATNTPLSPVSSDSEHGVVDGTTVTMGDDDASCTAETVVADSGDGPTWFQKPAHKATVKYTFDGTQWNYDSTQEGDATTVFAPPVGKTFKNADGTLTLEFVDGADDNSSPRNVKSPVGTMQSPFEMNITLKNAPLVNGDKLTHGDVTGTAAFKTNPLVKLGSDAYGMQVIVTDADAKSRKDDCSFDFYVVFNQSKPNTLDIYKSSDSDDWPVSLRDLKTVFLYAPADTALSPSKMVSISSATAGKATPDLTATN